MLLAAGGIVVKGVTSYQLADEKFKKLKITRNVSLCKSSSLWVTQVPSKICCVQSIPSTREFLQTPSIGAYYQLSLDADVSSEFDVLALLNLSACEIFNIYLEACIAETDLKWRYQICLKKRV